MLQRLVLHILFLLLAWQATAQNSRPQGDFLEESTKIGQPVKYALSFHHPKKMELFFPDSTYSYAPFEYIGKEYYPTSTQDSISVDSVVYVLRTFEVKNAIELSLPVFIVEQGDTTRLYSSHDKVNIRQYLNEVPDSLEFQSDTGYTPVKSKFNYPYALASVLLLMLMGMLFYLVLGKAVLRNYRLYKMHNNHIQFLRTFEKLHKEMSDAPNVSAMETVLGEWKNYLARLEQKPINTFTTTEIISLFNKEELKESLQEVDRSIYSGIMVEDPARALAVLKKFSNKRYKKRRKEVKNER